MGVSGKLKGMWVNERTRAQGALSWVFYGMHTSSSFLPPAETMGLENKCSTFYLKEISLPMYQIQSEPLRVEKNFTPGFLCLLFNSAFTRGFFPFIIFLSLDNRDMLPPPLSLASRQLYFTC